MITGNKVPAGGLEKAIKGLGLGETEVRFGEPLLKHTSLGIGGRADVFARPASTGDLARILAFDWQMPVFFLGGGTNLLVRDGNIRALFISTGGLKGMEAPGRENENGADITVRAGESLKGLLAFCMKNGFSGLEPLAGIPGSIGGAIAGNAGARGFSIGEVVRRVRVMGEKGEVREIRGEQMGFEYRGSALLSGGPCPGGPCPRAGLVMEAQLALQRENPAEIRAHMLSNFEMKKKTQPLSARSAGCVFKNPGGGRSAGRPSAGRLIEEAGLKGMRIGGIEVSRVHANFFINLGEGRADDFLRLMETVADEVEKRFDIRLEPEIRILGDGFQK